ncbi:dapper homolog 3-like [Lepus europaeus]|uniref:dapper homolog 3-like n=1 Tax=Lepus europaeus TaxID=9983 RepID=UPI002B4A7A02|nr:dapper homolog 3-like [Lepus europaeus]
MTPSSYKNRTSATPESKRPGATQRRLHWTNIPASNARLHHQSDFCDEAKGQDVPEITRVRRPTALAEEPAPRGHGRRSPQRQPPRGPGAAGPSSTGSKFSERPRPSRAGHSGRARARLAPQTCAARVARKRNDSFGETHTAARPAPPRHPLPGPRATPRPRLRTAGPRASLPPPRPARRPPAAHLSARAGRRPRRRWSRGGAEKTLLGPSASHRLRLSGRRGRNKRAPLPAEHGHCATSSGRDRRPAGRRASLPGPAPRRFLPASTRAPRRGPARRAPAEPPTAQARPGAPPLRGRARARAARRRPRGDCPRRPFPQGRRVRRAGWALAWARTPSCDAVPGGRHVPEAAGRNWRAEALWPPGRVADHAQQPGDAGPTETRDAPGSRPDDEPQPTGRRARGGEDGRAQGFVELLWEWQSRKTQEPVSPDPTLLFFRGKQGSVHADRKCASEVAHTFGEIGLVHGRGTGPGACSAGIPCERLLDPGCSSSGPALCCGLGRQWRMAQVLGPCTPWETRSWLLASACPALAVGPSDLDHEELSGSWTASCYLGRVLWSRPRAPALHPDRPHPRACAPAPQRAVVQSARAQLLQPGSPIPNGTSYARKSNEINGGPSHAKRRSGFFPTEEGAPDPVWLNFRGAPGGPGSGDLALTVFVPAPSPWLHR